MCFAAFDRGSTIDSVMPLLLYMRWRRVSVLPVGGNKIVDSVIHSECLFI